MSRQAMDELVSLGWTEARAEQFAPHAVEGLVPTRVILHHRLGYRVAGAQGEREVVLPGRWRHGAHRRADLPVVGDWVAVRFTEGEPRGIIQAVMPRQSWFSRKLAGDATGEQVVAANIDIVFLMTGLDADFNLRRIERYLVLAREGGTTPVILLNKTDACEDVATKVEATRQVAPGVPVHAVSVKSGAGLGVLAGYLQPGRTVALLGSSGVGKSSLINRLRGDESLRTGEVRASDQRGRHTTTRRELLRLPDGAMMIDTPGMREIQLWDSDEGFKDTFEDIAELAPGCRFNDCAHRQEPGCAVRQAVEDGRLTPGRLEHFHRLEDERVRLKTQQAGLSRLEEKRRWRTIHKTMRAFRPRE
jgi:ribosome biogenesis GTPase